LPAVAIVIGQLATGCW